MLFFKKGSEVKSHSVLKFFIVLKNDTWGAFVEQLEDLSSQVQIEVDEYSINYSDRIPIRLKAIADKLGSYQLTDIENLELGSSLNEYFISLSVAFRKLELKNLYELNFSLPVIGSDFESLADDITRILVGNFNVVYGYGRELEQNIEPVSENPIKKGFFGNTSVKVDNVLDVWYQHPSDLLSGSVKGLYQWNIISSGNLVKPPFADFSNGEETEIVPISEDVVALKISNDVLESLKKRFKGIAPYIRN